jgi:hypothetical protein
MSWKVLKAFNCRQVFAETGIYCVHNFGKCVPERIEDLLMDVETIFSASFAVLFVHFPESACITQGVCSIPRLTYVSVIFFEILDLYFVPLWFLQVCVRAAEN